MAYNNQYTWSSPVVNHKPTRYIQILSTIEKNGGSMSKRNLLMNVFGIYTSTNYVWAPETGYQRNTVNVATAKHTEGSWRGHHSHLFACMHSDNLITYNKSTKEWEIGKTGRGILNSFRNFYGTIFPNI